MIKRWLSSSIGVGESSAFFVKNIAQYTKRDDFNKFFTGINIIRVENVSFNSAKVVVAKADAEKLRGFNKKNWNGRYLSIMDFDKNLGFDDPEPFARALFFKNIHKDISEEKLKELLKQFESKQVIIKKDIWGNTWSQGYLGFDNNVKAKQSLEKNAGALRNLGIYVNLASAKQLDAFYKFINYEPFKWKIQSRKKIVY